MSLDWRNGVLVTTSCLCLILLFSPFFGLLYNKFLSRSKSESDRTNFFLPITVFDLNARSDSIRASRLSRVKNKGISAMLMMSTIIAEALILFKILPVSSLDIW